MLSWIPSAAASGVTGYRVYIARPKPGPLAAQPIDLGMVPTDATGVASVRLTNIDRTAPLLAVEVTTYNGIGNESARSNRVLLSGDGETVALPTWRQDFEGISPESDPSGFVDWGGEFDIRQASDLNLMFGSPLPSTMELAVSRNIGPPNPSWLPYELEGSILAVVGSNDVGVGVRVASADLSSAFLLGGDPSGNFGLGQIGKPNMQCAGPASTGVRIMKNKWFRFRLRYTDPGGLGRLRAKVWKAGETEPSVWQADCWTNAQPAPDSRAFALYHDGGGVAYWDDLVLRPVTGTIGPIPTH